MSLGPRAHVRKNDVVQVMVGKEKGKTGKVLRVLTSKGKVVVEKLNMVKRHSRPQGNQPGGIVEKEAPIAISNVLLYCEKSGKGVRTERADKSKKPKGRKGKTETKK